MVSSQVPIVMYHTLLARASDINRDYPGPIFTKDVALRLMLLLPSRRVCDAVRVEFDTAVLHQLRKSYTMCDNTLA